MSKSLEFRLHPTYTYAGNCASTQPKMGNVLLATKQDDRVQISANGLSASYPDAVSGKAGIEEMPGFIG
jgi:hypothetical protein